MGPIPFAAVISRHAVRSVFQRHGTSRQKAQGAQPAGSPHTPTPSPDSAVAPRARSGRLSPRCHTPRETPSPPVRGRYASGRCAGSCGGLRPWEDCVSVTNNSLYVSRIARSGSEKRQANLPEVATMRAIPPRISVHHRRRLCRLSSFTAAIVSIISTHHSTHMKPLQRISALSARRHLGQLLEEVYYRGSCYMIERAGRPMAVMVPVGHLAQRKRHSPVPSPTPQRRRTRSGRQAREK
jgi:antitoxin (DNA-binding transcriptional repressor) of toxin-antitoxin stability system